MESTKRSPKAIIVGGSIAGLSCAHILLRAGWDVTVVEKTSIRSTGVNSSGAGVALEEHVRDVINTWLGDPKILGDITFPMDNNMVHQIYDNEKKTTKMLRREQFKDFAPNVKTVHWSDLHSVILRALPQNIVLWGHRFLSFSTNSDGSVRIKAKDLENDGIVELDGDLLVAADGSMSSIRQQLIPDHKLRYSGYSALRGVYDYSDDGKLDVVTNLRGVYPELDNSTYADYADENHCLLIQINSKRLNWVWYYNTPEPERDGSSMTMKTTDEMVKKMHEKARKIWSPELTRLIEETKNPFVNVIYDSEPLPQLVWGNVVLVGDAAHPTTPHAFKSTNMSILDADALGSCLEKWGPENLSAALEEYQSVRLPVVSNLVLMSRQIGLSRQNMLLSGIGYDPKKMSGEN